jgi:HSP20 family protein
MIDRYDPFGRTMSLRQMMDRVMEDAFVMPRQGGAGSSPSVDVYEEGENLIVEAHLPGFKPENIDVNVERGVLTISGQSQAEDERTERNYLLREKRSGSFTRSLQLPPSYTTDPSQATFEHGVLHLVFPKSEAAKPRRIQITGASQQAMADGQGQAQLAGQKS